MALPRFSYKPELIKSRGFDMSSSENPHMCSTGSSLQEVLVLVGKKAFPEFTPEASSSIRQERWVGWEDHLWCF